MLFCAIDPKKFPESWPEDSYDHWITCNLRKAGFPYKTHVNVHVALELLEGKLTSIENIDGTLLFIHQDRNDPKELTSIKKIVHAFELAEAC